MHRLSARGELGRYFLAPSVTTDLDLLRQAVSSADPSDERFAENLVEAFSLIRGPLFSDVPAGYSWAYSDGTVSRIELDLTAMAAAAATSLIQTGFEDAARNVRGHLQSMLRDTVDS